MTRTRLTDLDLDPHFRLNQQELGSVLWTSRVFGFSLIVFTLGSSLHLHSELVRGGSLQVTGIQSFAQGHFSRAGGAVKDDLSAPHTSCCLFHANSANYIAAL